MAAYLAALGWKVAGAADDGGLVPKVDMDPNRPSARAVQKRKQAVARFVVGLAFVLASIGTLLWQLRWVKSAFAGPVVVTPADLRPLADTHTLANPWVSLAYDRSEDTGMGIASMSLLETILGTGRSRYLLIQIQDRWLIAEVPEDHAGKQATGCLEMWSTPLRLDALEAIHSRFPAHGLLPFQLAAHTPYRRECYAMLGLVAIFFLAGIYLIHLSVRRDAVKVSS
jgi:hypothetical protein